LGKITSKTLSNAVSDPGATAMKRDEIEKIARVGGCLVLVGGICVAFVYAFKTNTWTAWGQFWLTVLVILILAAAILSALASAAAERQAAEMRRQDDEAQRFRNEKFRALTIAKIDEMSGAEFEAYLQRVLISQGFEVKVTRASGDLGVDLIAARSGDSIAIQVKRYGTKISRRAISDAVAGMRHYGCGKAMVITNNYFTPGALALAASNDCTVVDRDTLANWITAFQQLSQGEAQLLIVVCRNCAQRLRVPNRGGLLRVSCPTCSNSFMFRT
jgi:multisubunit Na+/H+ antiporter MnhG subunit